MTVRSVVGWVVVAVPVAAVGLGFLAVVAFAVAMLKALSVGLPACGRLPA
ncbi:MAG: hypothetical protein Q8R60_12890 [Mycobacteriales bacterium]|nr:hypothetical protein [Mycobacteriales bacterium]